VRDVVVPISEPVTISELRESMCRWPIGDPAQPDFRFCGAKKLPDQGPYCVCHAGIAYQTQHDRRRERRSQSRPAPSPYDCWA
jgi:GcrA cell cycle regulator